MAWLSRDYDIEFAGSIEERWLKNSIVVTVIESNRMERGSHNVDLKCTSFNRSNDYTNNSACLDDLAIMAIFETCAVKYE